MNLERLKNNLSTLKKDVQKIKELTDGNLPLTDGTLMSGIKAIEDAIEKEENVKQ